MMLRLGQLLSLFPRRPLCSAWYLLLLCARLVVSVTVVAPSTMLTSVCRYLRRLRRLLFSAPLLILVCLVVGIADVDAPSALFPFLVQRASFSRSPLSFPRRPNCLPSGAVHVLLPACFAPSSSLASDAVAAAPSDVDSF
jgi:hypothetical protein